MADGAQFSFNPHGADMGMPHSLSAELLHHAVTSTVQVPEKEQFSTPEKFEIVDIVFRAYTMQVPNTTKSMRCSDFYPLFFAATPPDVWLSIAWIGRRIHSVSDTMDSIRTAMQHNTVDGMPDSVPVPVPMATGSRKRKAGAKKTKSAKEIAGVTLVPQLDMSNPTKEVLQLKRLCDVHNVPFVTSPDDERVQIARDVIELYYSAMRSGGRKRAHDLLEMLKTGLGYSSTVDLNALRDRVSMANVAQWRGTNLVDVPRNGSYPPFFIFYEEGTLTIEISTFHLKYTIDMERNVLYLNFTIPPEEVEKAHFYQVGLIHTTSGAKGEKFQMVVTIPQAFDESTIQVDKRDDYVLSLSVKEHIKSMRRRIADTADA